MASKLAARLALLCAAVSCNAVTQTQDNVRKLEGFENTGASLNIETVPRGGTRAAALKASLEQVKLPPGFKIDLCTVVPDARHMAIGPNTDVVLVSTRKTRVWAVSDRTEDRVADEARVFASSTSFKTPNGLCFSPDDVFYVAEQSHVLAFPAADFFYGSPDVATVPVVSQGELVPVEEENSNHTARTCRIGPDDKLHITLSNPFNVPPKEEVALYDRVRMMSIIQMNRDGKHRGIFAHGVRSSVGMDFNPKGKTLWFTDNQVDGMGDDIPPSGLNRTTRASGNFGFPWYGGGHIRTVEHRSKVPSFGVVFPQVEIAAHVADLGMTFYEGKMFPTKYQGGVFSAQHGPRNHTTPVGTRIVYMPVKTDETAGKTEVFAERWLTSNNKYLGQPVDAATLPGGSLLISDDYAGAVYKVSYATE